ncbi:hypothetical protein CAUPRSCDRAFT_12917, partial [Caulochytrium protostelioides]
NRYLLLGSEKGLYFIDLKLPTAQQEPVPLIRNTRFRQIEILEQYGVMVALSGKHDHIRQYRLSSIRKLVSYVTGDNVWVVSKDHAPAKPDASVPAGELPMDDAMGSATAGNEYEVYPDKPEVASLMIRRWSSDYIKILATKDSKSFKIQRTETSVYMGVLFRQDIILFEWAREPYLKFMKLKAFWLPESPKFMHLLHDGVAVREIFLGYSNEANLVSIDNSRVKE